jgi:hypothetical protein
MTVSITLGHTRTAFALAREALTTGRWCLAHRVEITHELSHRNIIGLGDFLKDRVNPFIDTLVNFVFEQFDNLVHRYPAHEYFKNKRQWKTMPLWHSVQIEDVEFGGARNGTTKFSVKGQSFRFQAPKGAVLYNGLSGYKSITIDVPEVFTVWWRQTLEPALTPGLIPFNSNLKETGLRVKVDKSTQFFNSKKEIYFPELNEGLLSGASVQCIIEITGTYFFQGTHGLTIRAHQIVVSESESAVEIDDTSTTLKGFSFI